MKFCSILVYGEKVNYMHRSCSIDIQEKIISWCSNCDQQRTNLLHLHSNRCELHKNRAKAESDSNLAFDQTENLARFLLRASRVKLKIIFVSLSLNPTCSTANLLLESAGCNFCCMETYSYTSKFPGQRAHHFKDQSFIFQIILNRMRCMQAFPVQILGENERNFQLFFFSYRKKKNDDKRLKPVSTQLS